MYTYFVNVHQNVVLVKLFLFLQGKVLLCAVCIDVEELVLFDLSLDLATLAVDRHSIFSSEDFVELLHCFRQLFQLKL